MKNKIFLGSLLCWVVCLPAIGQSEPIRAFDIYSIYDKAGVVLADMNKGNELKANGNIDGLLDLQSSNYNDVVWGFLFDYKGMILHHQGNYYLAKKYFQLASVYSRLYQDKDLLGYNVNNFILLLTESKDTSGFKSASNQQSKEGIGSLSDTLLLGIQSNQAYNALYNHDTVNAKMEFQKLARFYKTVDQSDPVWIKVNRLFGTYYQEIGDYKTALAYLKKAANQSERVNGPGHFQTGQSWLRLGDFYSKLDRRDSALLFYEKANRVIGRLGSDTLNASSQHSYETVFIESSIKLGKILEQKKATLAEAYGYYTKAIERIFKLSHSITSETSRFILADKGRLAFDAGISCAVKLYESTGDHRYFDEALNWSIQAKSLSLNQLLESEQIYPLVGISKDLSIKLKKLRQRLDLLFGETLEQPQTAPVDTLVRVIRDYEITERLIQSRYEQISQVRDQNDVFPTTFLQNLTDAIYLGYHELDSVIIVFSPNGPGPKYSIIPKNARLLSDLDRFRKIVSTQPLNVYSPGEVKEFSDIGVALYVRLIGPFLKDFDGHHILIHADGSLLGIPFGALVQRSSDSEVYKDLPYLMKDYVVQYVSTPMLTKGAPVEARNGLSIVTCRNSTGIPEAAREVKGLSASVPHSAICTIDDLQFNPGSISKTGKRIHIASHAVINTPDPMKSGLACSPDGPVLVSFSDILNLDLAGSRVFINGCQSGDGPLNHGEGLMSLGLAFSLAGSRTVVQHLWIAPDRSSLILAEGFYRSIKRAPDADGLRESQLKYLNTISGGSDHPYYWSGLVCYGGYEPAPRNLKFIPWLLILAAASMIYLLARYRRR